MLYYRQVPNLSQTNLNEIYASQTASIERGGHPDMEFLQFQDSDREGQPKAVRVPTNARKEVPERAFHSAPMLRHVEVV